MQWRSTRGEAPPVTFREALFAGLARDGGLYMPAPLEPVPRATFDTLAGRNVAEVGTEVAAHLIGDEIQRDALARLIGEALNFDIPLVKIGPAEAGPSRWSDRADVGTFKEPSLASGGAGFSRPTYALELFHGPTFAFKDVGARVMARLMAHFVAPGDSLTVLVATSGDTGSAVAQAFAGVAGTRVVVLYPEGQVSDVQEAQFATIGGNVRAVAVAGTFDDCQALVKAAFRDARLREDAQLTSANSINVGRLLPQTFYYAWGALQHPDAVWSVPSGNFGNLTAGLIAKRLGFPIAHFVAATNVNDVVPQYLASGTYRPRASVRTIANAMDVGAPSNFERIQSMYGGSVDRVRADVRGLAFDDPDVTAAIADVHSRHGYVLDPHSAIAWLGLQQQPGIFVATAHPAKFRETVEPAIGRRMDLPPALQDALTRPRLITRIAPRLNELADLLR